MKLLLDGVEKSFEEKAVLRDASYTFEQGKIYGLLGRNGSGKTTLFNCISHNLKPDNGTIMLEKGGQLQADFPDTEVGFVYASPHLPGFMTGYEFVKFFIEINRHRINDLKEPEEYLAQVGIEAADQKRLLKDYSHGMQNKIQMLTSLITEPPVLLLDEPLTSFDVVAAHEMKEQIIALKKSSILIFSTHILQLAQDLCDEIVLLHDGHLQGIDSARIHDQDFEEEVVALLTHGSTQGEVEQIEERL